jgi:putative zinc finger protein
VTALDPYAHYDGSYVLGALSDEERADFEEHLRTCVACTERVRELDPLPGLLAGLPASAYDDAADDFPDTLLPGLLAQVRTDRRRRHWITAGLSGLAAACLVALAVVVWPTGHHPTPGVSTPRAVAMSAVASSPVEATAALSDVQWGTSIELACRYDSSYVAGRVYQLVVLDKHNVAHPAGSWEILPGKVTKFTGGTALKRDEISKVEITTANDEPVLQLVL